MWKSTGIVAIVLLVSGCALFESDIGPIDEEPPADAGMDAADASSEPDDAGDVDMGQDVGSGDAETADVGSDPGDGGGMPDGPWRCEPTTLGSGADPTRLIQLEALSGNKFIAGWGETDSLEFVEFDVVPVGALSRPSTGAEQDFHLITADEADYYLATLSNGLEECSQGAGCTPYAAIPDVATAVNGDWNGGEYRPYVHYFDGDTVATRIVTGPTTGYSTLTTQVTATDAKGFRMAQVGLPPQVEFMTPTHAVYVAGDELFYYQVLTASDDVDQTAANCFAQLGNVQKVIPGNRATQLFADVTNGREVSISRIACEELDGLDLTGSVIGLRDWDVVEAGRSNYVFFATDGGLQLSIASSSNTRFEVAAGDFRKVAAARRGDDGFGVVTVDAEGNVELRSFDRDGRCE